MDTRRTMPALDDDEERVRIAVKALDDMRNQRTDANRWSQPSTSSDIMLSPARDVPPSESTPASPALFTRMSSIPLVKSALTVYEQGKASSRVVKYGAQMVESSVKTLSRPVIDRLPVDQLDEFACRQLDRLDRYRRPSTSDASSPSPSSSHPTLPSPTSPENFAHPRSPPSTFDGSDSHSNRSAGTGAQSYRSRRAWMEGGERGVPSWIDTRASFSSSPSAERSLTPTQRQGSSQHSDEGRKSSGNGSIATADAEKTPTEETANEQQVAQRSRWQAVLLEAGGLSAALSEESMRRLKYCLQWLQYATAHIDAQILILRELTASLQTNPPSAPAHARRPNPISEEHLRKLVEVRKDVVKTVREVVNVVSKYTGGALPEPARTTVRGFILKLPQRWASKVGGGGGGVGMERVGERERERESVAAAASGVAGRRSGTRRSNVARERGAAGEPRSGASSTVGSPSASPRVTTRLTLAPLTTMPGHHPSGHAGGDEQAGSASGLAPNGQPVSHGAVVLAAERLLSLATESLDMMRGVTGVVKDSLDKAELWVGRLRTVGLQRGAQEGREEGDADSGAGLPPASEGHNGYQPSHPHHRAQHHHQYHSQYHHHRRGSTSTQFSDDMLDDSSSTMPPSPFLTSQSGASTVWGSSVPSTPGGSEGVGMSGVVQIGSAVAVNGGVEIDGRGAGQKSPVLVSMGAMTLASRCGTPRSVVGELPEEEEEERGVVGGEGRMDVDEV